MGINILGMIGVARPASDSTVHIVGGGLDPDYVADFTRVHEAAGFDAVLIGAGVRTAPDHFLLFEKLINAVHRHAPQAAICFNTNPTDTAAAVQRWA